MYEIFYSKKSAKQITKNFKNTSLEPKLKNLIYLIKQNPYQIPPPYEKLLNTKNCYSRRINIQHRLVYEINENDKKIHILSVWTHYEF